MNPLPPALRDAPGAASTEVACLRQLMDTTPTSTLAILLGSVLMTLWLRDVVPPGWIGGWLTLILLLAAVRIGLAATFRRRFTDEAPAAPWLRAYALCATLTGATWGALAWLPMSDPDGTRLVMVSALLFCVMLVGASTLISSRLASAGFALALLLPLLARLLDLDGRTNAYLATGMGIMGLLLLRAFRNQHRTLIAALDSSYRSQNLLRQQRVILESAGEGIVLLHPAPAFTVECNRRFAELFGYPMDEMAGMEPWRWHPDRNQWKRLVIDSAPVIARGEPYRQVLQLKRADGSLFWGEVTGMAVDRDNLRAGTVWIVSDLSPQREAEGALRVSERRFRELVKLSSDVYWEQDEHFRFTHFDGPAEILHQLDVSRLIGRSRWEIRGIVGVSEASWRDHIATLGKHEPFRDFVYQMKGVDGMRRWYAVSGNPLFDAEGRFTGYHGTASDISNRIENEARFRHLAYHDGLTQLPNRRLLEDRLRQAIRGATRGGYRVALLLIDLDGFKRVNDEHGHATGDRVLETIARRLQDAVREMDTVARLGGDEFVVLLPQIADIEDALAVADKIHDVIATPIRLGEHVHQVGSSIGASVYPEHGDEAATLLHHADHAMYHGKRQGGRTTRIFDAAALT